MSDKSVLMSCQISSSGWKLVPVEPTEEMLDSFYANVVVQRTGTVSNFKGGYQAMLAAAPDAPSAARPVAWMSPGKERLEFSRPDTVYGSHTIPLYAIPPDAAAEIARLRAEVERLTEQVRYRANSHEINCGLIAEKTATIAQQAERIAELDGAGERMSERIGEIESDLNDFHMAVEHVTENGNTKRSFSTSEGWAMVHKDRLTDLEIAEERIAAQAAALAKARDALIAALADDLPYINRSKEALAAIDALMKGNE